jgi:hypothetical protein
MVSVNDSFSMCHGFSNDIDMAAKSPLTRKALRTQKFFIRSPQAQWPGLWAAKIEQTGHTVNH